MFGVAALQAYAGQQRFTQGLQVVQAAGECLAIGGVDQRQPLTQRLAGRAVFQAEAVQQLRGELDLLSGWQQFPPAGAE